MARPEGSVETPYNLVKADLKETLKQQKQIRKLFQEQLDAIQEELKKPAVPMQDRLKVMAALATMSESLTKSMQQAAKYVLAPEKDSGGEGEKKDVPVEDVLKEFIKGGGRG